MKRILTFTVGLAIIACLFYLSYYIIMMGEPEPETDEIKIKRSDVQENVPPEFDTGRYQRRMNITLGRWTFTSGGFGPSFGKFYKSNNNPSYKSPDPRKYDIVKRFSDVFDRYIQVNYGKVPGHEYNESSNDARSLIRAYLVKEYRKRHGPIPEKNPQLDAKNYVDSHPFRVTKIDEKFEPITSGFNEDNDPWVKGVITTTVCGYVEKSFFFIKTKEKYRVIYTFEATFTMLGTDDATYELVPDEAWHKRPEGHKYCRVLGTQLEAKIEPGWS